MTASWNTDLQIDALSASLPRITAIIGGGGKTTLMWLLANRLAEQGRSVLVTTTTHLAWPPPNGIPLHNPTTAEALDALAENGRLLLAGFSCGNGKMRGTAVPLTSLSRFDHILCEADGSNRRPLKLHREDEPVIPEGTGLVIQVAGLSALGKPCGEVLHRYPLMGLSGWEPVDEALLLSTILRAWQRHPGGGVTLLNQADTVPYTVAQNIQWQLEQSGYPALVTSLKGSRHYSKYT